MEIIVQETQNKALLEDRLRAQKDPKQRLVLLDQLAQLYTFSDVDRAKTLLEEQGHILDTYDYPDFRLNYHINLANIQNQLYQYELSEENFEKVLELLKDIGTVNQQAEAYIDYAGTAMNMENLEFAANLLHKAHKILNSFPEDRLMARLNCREGFLNLQYSNYSGAIELFLEAEKNLNKLHSFYQKDYYFQTLLYSGLGKVYERNDDYERSVAAYQKVIEICKAMQYRTRLSWHYLNAGAGYMALDDYENAENYFEKAIHADDDSSQLARASAYGNLGFIKMEKERYNEALDLFEKAEDIYKGNSEEDYYNFSFIESWRARIFAEQEELEKALDHFVLAFEYASLIEDYKQLASVSKEMASFYAELNDYKSAYRYQLLHDKFLEQYTEQLNKRKQMEIEVKYEAAKKRQEAELLKLQATKLQLKALRAQMNPHFMYNALNSIQNYITSNDVKSAAKYLAKFAKLMRQSLEYSEREIISLEKEIEFLENYLYINEKLRFEDRMSYEIYVDDEIEEDILGVPTMIVQPYVENAIEHGLRTKKDGVVKVQFSFHDDDTILCAVEDNGIGRDKARQIQMQDPAFTNHKSRGTRITEDRLKILHNTKDQGVFVSTIDLKNPDTGHALGTRVEILIPIVEIQMKY